MSKKMRLLRSLTSLEIFQQILSINISALDEIIVDGTLDQWKILIESYQSSIEEAKVLATTIRSAYVNSLASENEQVDRSLLNWLSRNHPRWFNTLRSTLWMMEEEFVIAGGNDACIELWEIFFDVEAETEQNHKIPLGLIRHIPPRKNN